MNLRYLFIKNCTRPKRIVVTSEATILEVVIEGQENLDDVNISPLQQVHFISCICGWMNQ